MSVSEEEKAEKKVRANLVGRFCWVLNGCQKSIETDVNKVVFEVLIGRTGGWLRCLKIG